MNNILVGHEFDSSFKFESTYFDVAKIKQIRKNETTFSQIIELMGKPQGECLYPLIKNKVYHVKFIKKLLKLLLFRGGSQGGHGTGLKNRRCGFDSHPPHQSLFPIITTKNRCYLNIVGGKVEL